MNHVFNTYIVQAYLEPDKYSSAKVEAKKMSCQNKLLRGAILDAKHTYSNEVPELSLCFVCRPLIAIHDRDKVKKQAMQK